MTNKSEIIIFSTKDSTSFTSFKNLGYTVIYPYNKRKRTDYRVRALLHILNIEKYKLFDSFFEINQEINECTNPKIIIIIGSLIFEPFIKKLRNKFPKAHIVYSYSNIVKDLASINPSILKKYEITGVSWDKIDCKKYGLQYQRPGIDPTILNRVNTQEICYDVCFIGADKHRYKSIKEIEKIISNAGFCSYIHITPDYSFFKTLHKDYQDKIPYSRYLEIVASSRCIIDFVQKGQVGTTMRTMEAIFNGKKLISNNQNLKDYDFYNPNNIFIVTKDNLNDIPDFLKSPFIPIDENILSRYTLKNCIREMIVLADSTHD